MVAWVNSMVLTSVFKRGIDAGFEPKWVLIFDYFRTALTFLKES